MPPPPSSPPLRISVRLFLAALLMLGLGEPALAQEDTGFTAFGPGRRPRTPDICMNDAELEAEAIVRGGMVIRDQARACARRGLDGSILPIWGAFDEANAQKFRDAVQIRSEAYKRNWPDDPYAEQRANNATVASRQITDFAPQECVALGNLVDGMKTWDDYMRHIRSTELGQVKTKYKRCPGKKRR